MVTKSGAGGSVLTCRICGGEVNPRGECVVCGAKQEPGRATAPDKGLAAWLKGESSEGGLTTLVGKPAAAESATAEGRDEALRKWLSGEDTAFMDWIGAPAIGASSAKGAKPVEAPSDEKLKELRSKALEAEGLRSELDAMRATLSRELGTFRTGRFDPVKYIEETATLSKQVQTEMARRKALEEEIEHIKKGSLAVIKYVKSQQLKQGPSADLKKRADQETSARKRIETELAELKASNEKLKDKIEVGLAKLKPDARQLAKREIELAEREATLSARESMAPPAGEGEPGAATEELKRRLEEELREKEQDYLAKDEAFKRRIISLEEQVGKFQIEAQVQAQAKSFESKPKGEVESALKRKEQELLAKERSMLLREQEVQRLQEEIQLKDDEMKRMKEPLAFKEDEMLRREQDLMYREKRLEAEMRKLEQLKAEGISSDERDMQSRLEELKTQITQKEEEVRSKEAYLQQKMEDLHKREQGLIEEEIDARSDERQMEAKQQKVKTGIARLDDLMFGGIPYSSNVSVYGPAYVGKEVVVNIFMAEGLRKGVPALWVLTDKSPADIREEMTFVLDSYATYEEKGLVKYIDAYTKSMGGEANTDAADPNTTYIADPTDHQAILKAVDQTAADWKKKYPTYRLAFRSVSTLIAYLDPTTTFKFLQPFVGRRKRDKAVAVYVIEKGMHEDQEIQMLGSIMDGSLEFKVEQLKSYVSVKGIGDVQSRGWIRYTYTKSSVSIGSFSLDHIK